MKKLLFILMLVFALHTIHAQSFGIAKGETASSETPEAVTKQFKKDYPTLNVMWSKENYNWRADYTDPVTNLAGLVVYDKSGRVIRSENELQANSYPGSINDYHNNTLPKPTKYRVYASKDTTGAQSFYSTTGGETYYFDKDGNYVKDAPEKPMPTKKAKK